MTMTKKQIDPATVARDGVAAWFEALTTSPRPDSHVDMDFDGLCSAVWDAVLNSPAYENAEADDAGARVMAAMDAGYLVGVQVGLRLRPGGA